MLTLEIKLFIDAIIEIFETLNQRWGWTMTVTLFSAGIALLVHLFILLVFPRVKLYNPSISSSRPSSPSKRPAKNPASRHVWVKGHTWLGAGEGPSYCNHCDELVLQGLICIVCGCCAHKEHLDEVSFFDCKYGSVEDLPVGHPADAHQWVKGNLPLHANCLQCERYWNFIFTF